MRFISEKRLNKAGRQHGLCRQTFRIRDSSPAYAFTLGDMATSASRPNAKA